MRLSCQVKVNGDCTIQTQPEFNLSGENFCVVGTKKLDSSARNRGGLRIDDFNGEIGGQRRQRKKQNNCENAHTILLFTRKGLSGRIAPVSWLCE